MTRRSRLAVAAVAAAALAALTGCAGVPSASAPEAIQSVPVGRVSAPAINPYPGESARDVVINFLQANAIDPQQHASARQFLTSTARNRWSDATATVVAHETVGTYLPGKPQVVVTGRIVGTLDANGVFTASRQGEGAGGARVPFVYRVRKVKGQYRIDNPSKGLLLTVNQFRSAYRRHGLYFFDLADRYLVPDLRWSALSGSPLQDWLLNELAAGPSPALQNAVNTDSLPTTTANQSLFVKPGTPAKIDIPGAAQSSAADRYRLAAQVATTLNDVAPDALFEITDGGTPVRIQGVNSTEFTANSFAGSLGPQAPAPAVYYLRGGHIVDSDGKRLSGAANSGRYGYFSSFAVSRLSPTAALSVAAVTGNKLYVGGQFSGLRQAVARGELTRPVWAPGRDEVWVGDGSRVLRVVDADDAGHAPQVQPVAVPSLGHGRKVIALRLSPEGSRIAVVIGTKGGANQLYVGAVIRTAGQVRVDLSAAPISPGGISVDDVAWIEPLSFIAIGKLVGSNDPRIFTANVDGSLWNNSSIGNLPSQPDSVTVEAGDLAWVSANGTVWYQSGGRHWTSPGRTGQTFGYAPVYLE